MSLKVGEHLPSLENATTWINVTDINVTNPSGPMLLSFWAMSCPACKLSMPAIHLLRDHYAPFGLSVIAVHMPRGDSDIDLDRVRRAVAELGITEPCAIDNNHAIGDAFQTGGMWPSYFLFDAEGKLRCRAAGGFGVSMMERALTRIFPDTPALDKSACSCGKTSGGGCCQDS